MPPRFTVSKLAFSDNTVIDLTPTDTVVFVGPNNSGKSRCLKEIMQQCYQPHPAQAKVVPQVVTKAEGTHEELDAYLQQWALRTADGAHQSLYEGLNWSIDPVSARSLWDFAYGQGLQTIAPLFCCLLTTEGRLKASQPAPSVAFDKAYTNPIHYLQFDENIEARISGYVRRAFGYDLVVHRNFGATVPLLIGNAPTIDSPSRRFASSYIKKLSTMGRLDEQGDGVRSFVGVLLETSVVARSLVLIDEPEAFLHPPQARLIGRLMARRETGVSQLFVATHSGDIVRGLLDGESQRLRVVRIERAGDGNRVRELSPDRVRDLWGNPLLRYSNALDGLFHEKVAICEGDGDCRFYGAIYNSIVDADDTKRRYDVMFIHCGGKHRMPQLVCALRAVGVPVTAVCDIDVLREVQPLRALVEASGGCWQSVIGDWSTVRNAIAARGTEMTVDKLRLDINAVVDAEPAGAIASRQVLGRIQERMRAAGPWHQVKRFGIAAIPEEAATAAQRLLAALHALGIAVVEVGELEGFDRSINIKGPNWVNRALAGDLTADPKLKEVRFFVEHKIVGRPA